MNWNKIQPLWALENGQGTGTEPAAEPAAEPDVEPKVEPAAEPEPEPKPQPAPNGVVKRIDQLTREKYELQDRLQKAETERARMESQLKLNKVLKLDGDQPSLPADLDAEIERRAKEKLKVEMAQQAEVAFNNECNKIAAQGKTQFNDFDESLANINTRLGGMSREFMEALIESGKGAEIINTLGKDWEKATEILAMPPIKQAVAVAKLAAQFDRPASTALSKAPAPIEPKVGGRAKAEPRLDDPNLSMAEWAKLRSQTRGGKK